MLLYVSMQMLLICIHLIHDPYRTGLTTVALFYFTHHYLSIGLFSQERIIAYASCIAGVSFDPGSVLLTIVKVKL